MKWMAATLLSVCFATTASAIEIKGKWGIGANLFDSGPIQASLIRGHSERTAWVMDLALDQYENTGQGGGVFNRTDLGAGPRLRRYVRASEDFSPYWDVWVHGIYSAYHNSDTRLWGAGVGGGVDFGLEYFTHWHCSAAIHSSVISGTWVEQHIHGRDYSSFPYRVANTVTHTQTSTLGLRPALVVRAYF